MNLKNGDNARMWENSSIISSVMIVFIDTCGGSRRVDQVRLGLGDVPTDRIDIAIRQTSPDHEELR